MAVYRQGRIDEEVKKELSAVIKELKDPRISGLVSVVSVSVTKDLRYANNTLKQWQYTSMRSTQIASV